MLDAIAEKFRFMADTRYSRKSPLYRQLASGVADDPDVLDLLSGTDIDKQLPNLLMGAVHFLLLKGVEHPLRAYYATFTDAPHEPDDTIYPVFRDFCLQHAAEIRQIVETRWVQVNEVQRCAVLLPALAEVSRRAKGEPLAVFEIGASAGLLLLWDRYRYDYGDMTLGSADSPIALNCELRGDLRPPLQEMFPSVTARLGMDINPIDLQDPDEALWLRALVWPGQTERAERLQQAITLAQANPPRVLKGDARTDVLQLAAHLPDDAPLCIFYSALIQVAREAANEQITELAQQRPVYLISFSGQTITLYDYVNDSGAPTQLANGFGIGEWIEWLVPNVPG